MALSFSKLFKSFKKNVVGRGKENVVGVDIGSSSVKVVELHSNRGVPTLSTYGELQLGPYGGIEVGRTTNLSAEKLTEALVDIMRESSVGTREAALAISYNSSFATVIDVPTANAAEVAGMVPVEAKKYIPVPLNTVSLDWFPIGEGSSNHSTKVLIAAIHNDALRRQHSVLEGAGLHVGAAEIEIFSTIRSVASRSDNVVAMIDLGAAGTRLYIAKKGMVAKIHGLRMSGSGITSLLASTEKIGFGDAEEEKRRGLENNPKAKKIVMDVFEREFREMNQVIKHYESEEGDTVEKVILSGGGALLPGLDTYAQDVFSKSVVYADSFSKVAYPAFLEDTLRTAGPSFSVAIGVALQQLIVAEE